MLTTFAALIVTIVLIGVITSRQAPPSNPSVLTPPAVPVADSIPRQGTTLGSLGAPVKMDAWEDFQCPYCQAWTIQFEPHVVQDFVATGVVSYQFHDYAFLGDGHSPDESLDAAVAAQCANDQGKFWQYHDWLYANQNPNGENQGWFTTARLDAIALKVGLNQATFDTCRADPAKAATVEAEVSAGVALGISGTPSIYVDGKLQTLTTYDALAATIRTAVPSPAIPSPAVPSASPTTSAAP